MKLYVIPFSTNVERVALALGVKGLTAKRVAVDPADRAPVVALSGQELVPVLELGDGTVVADSTAILRRLDAEHPAPPLWPADPARAAEVDVFADWFDRVWKVAPNAIADGHGNDADWDALRDHLDRFEALLGERPFLLGDELTAADLLAFPFLRYGAAIDPSDDERFHQVLHQGQPLDGHPRVADWIARIDRLPRG